MAEIGGRNLALSWVAGVLCTGVVAALFWFAVPMVPVLGEFFGGVLRSAVP